MTNGEHKMLMRGVVAGVVMGLALGLVIAFFIRPEWFAALVR